MLELPADIKPAFKQGGFSIRQTSGTFNSIWSDMSTEKTIIKDSKGSGGIVGIINQKSALVRWTHFLASLINATNERAGFTSRSENSHEEINQTALKRDEEQVHAIVNHLNTPKTDPFDIDAHFSCLINISTCMHATREVKDSLLSAVNEGENMCRKVQIEKI
ncbi:unnamed protein product [Mytilus coruscus]|uniref:Uncharacterized protein n=1 Tax=Mytilus coruscus TaxID=42192 RepID=A0A6J8DMG8_MYTCO|nr:unnamed protein product [Mytilus coruscus]